MAYTDPIPEDPSSPNSLLTPTTRCCFCFPRISSRRRIHHSGDHNSWWARGVRVLKKIREWSEIVAGPKWKTFIRRFNRHTGNRGSGNRHGGKFQYDPLSYALNFDEGPGGQNGHFDEDDDFGGFRDFSSRYAFASGSGRPLGMEAKNNSINEDVAVIA